MCRRSAQLDSAEAPRHLPKLKLHQKRIMVTVWWSAADLIHRIFLNPHETITAEKYCQQVDEMHQKLKRICSALVNRKGPILLYNNAIQYVSMTRTQKLHELCYETLDHPPYLPVLSPTDFKHFFKHVNNFLQEKKPSMPSWRLEIQTQPA